MKLHNLNMNHFKILLITILFSSLAQAGLLYSYSRLTTKDLDEMTKLVHTKINESKVETGDKTMPLKEALQAVFSRPNEDFLIEKILPPLRAELEERSAWEKTVKALITEALGALKNPKAFRPDAQITYLFFLENWMAENKPKAKEKFENSTLVQIRDANIEVSKEAQKERQNRMMREAASPSKIAQIILDNVAKEAAAPETTEKAVVDPGH